ncbi:MAG: hypothetical protein U1E15_05860 [Hyphomicrobiales bacterium]
MGWSVLASSAAFATIDNTAQAVGTYNGNPVSSNTSSVSVPVAPPQDTVTLVKSATINDGGDGHVDPGDTITYTFTVTNTGLTSLSNVTLTDAMVTPGAPVLTDNGTAGDSSDGILSAGWDVLGPGDVLAYSATYAPTAADLAVAHVANSATVIGDTAHATQVTATSAIDTAMNVTSGISLNKVAVLQDGGDGIANAGDQIAYTFTVTNTGYTNLTNVSVDDPQLNVADLPGKAAASQMMAALAAGADPIATASTDRPDPATAAQHALTLYRDVASRLVSLVWPNLSPAVEPPQLAVELGIERKLVMLSGDPGAPKAGDRVGIYFNLSNAGEGPLVALDVKQEGAEAYGSALDYLAPNASDTASIIFTRVLTADDVASGELAGAATVTAKSRNRVHTFTVAEALPLAAISGPEELATASISPAQVPLLAPGASATFTATMALTQPMVDAGSFTNTATASGDTPSAGTLVSPPASATVDLPALPGIALIKQGTVDLGADGIASVGDVISYTFEVKNTGNVTLNGITLADAVAGVTLAGGPRNGLAPNTIDSTTFTATHALTQADIDAGQFENWATATGTAPDGTTTVQDDPMMPTSRRTTTPSSAWRRPPRSRC